MHNLNTKEDIMKVREKGYEYEVKNLTTDHHQTVRFVKEPSTDNFEPGTTNEEILDMLIHRMNYLNAKLPCRENSIAITKLQEARMWLKERAMDRNLRGVKHTMEL